MQSPVSRQSDTINLGKDTSRGSVRIGGNIRSVRSEALDEPDQGIDGGRSIGDAPRLQGGIPLPALYLSENTQCIRREWEPHEDSLDGHIVRHIVRCPPACGFPSPTPISTTSMLKDARGATLNRAVRTAGGTRIRPFVPAAPTFTRRSVPARAASSMPWSRPSSRAWPSK